MIGVDISFFSDPSKVYKHARIGTFFQEKPVLQNPYLSDTLLQSFLRRHVPSQVLFCKRFNLFGDMKLLTASQYYQDIHGDLARFGNRVSNEIDERGLECEKQPPTLTHFDAWGKRIDRIDTCDSWKYMKKISAEEGLIAIGYERKYGKARSVINRNIVAQCSWKSGSGSCTVVFSRIYQMAKLFVFGSSCGLYSCPLAMTDAAAKVLENLTPNVATDNGIRGNAFRYGTIKTSLLDACV